MHKLQFLNIIYNALNNTLCKFLMEKNEVLSFLQLLVMPGSWNLH